MGGPTKQTQVRIDIQGFPIPKPRNVVNVYKKKCPMVIVIMAISFKTFLLMPRAWSFSPLKAFPPYR